MLFHNSDFSLAPVPTRCFPPRSFSRLTRLEHGFNCVPWLPEGRGGGGWKSWPLEALGRIPENSRVTKALRMESRGGEKRAWRRKYSRTEDARLRSGCASVGNDVSRAAASPCGKRARSKNTRAWKLSLLVNEDRGNLCNLCNRSRRERVGGGEKQPRCNFLLRFPVLNAFFDDPRCRFLSYPLRLSFSLGAKRYRFILSPPASLESRSSETSAVSFDQPFREARRVNHRRWNIHSRRRNNTNTCCTQNSRRASSSFEPRCLVFAPLPSSLSPVSTPYSLTASRFAPISTRDARVRLSSV